MLDLIVYLLPLSGELLLQELLELENVRIKTALLPENFIRECQSLLPVLEKNDIRYKFPRGNLEDEELRNWVRKDNYDLGVSIGYDKKLPSWLINTPRLQSINIHPSLLPSYRGGNPYFWVIKNREKKTGVTLHIMDENFDTGPVICQEEYQLNENALMGEIFITLNKMGSQMAGDLVDRLAGGEAMPETTPQGQVEDPPTAPRVEDRHLRIDWSESFADIEALVRAGNPFFGAFSLFKGQKLEIYELEKAPEIEKNSKPGRIFTTDKGPAVCCGNGWARLKNVSLQHQYRLSGQAFQRREKETIKVLKQLV